MIEQFLIPKLVYDVCQNDCIIYRRKYKDLESCSICGSQRYLPSTKAVSSNRRVACRKFIYLPIGPRLKHMFGNISLCELMISHAQLIRDGVAIMLDIHDSPVWRQEYSTDGFF